MTPKATEASVSMAVTVEASQATAFRTFTEDMGSWWPIEHHILEGTLDRIVFEQKVGGDVYDLATDGSRCRWARVLAFDPPERVVISWDISLAWQLETDLSKTSEIEVRFVKVGPRTTTVELEHRHLDRHGERWEPMREMLGSPSGWGGTLRQFAEHLASVAPDPD
ncbi:MAG TPA: SRPBCC family protein [Acidimicrobiales bacterium]|jgi:uncharacterized protein YndB with AHSA1/START domain|nr:SRPBCC family protein [Acidimicrobiales bacterium]